MARPNKVKNSLRTRYLKNNSREFQQIYNFRAVGTNILDKLIIFWGQRSRSQWGYVWATKHSGRHFLAYLWNV